MFSIGPISRYRFSESPETYASVPGTSVGVATVTGRGSRGGKGTSSGVAAIAGKGSRGAKGSSSGVAAIAGKGSRGGKGTAAGTSIAISIGAGAGKGTSAGIATVSAEGATSWDLMLAQANAPIAYFAEIEPWVLTDRS